MSDVSFAPTPDDLRLMLRRELEASESGLRLVAQEVLAHTSTIDLVGVDSHGRAVLVWIAETGRDLETFTRALSGRSWAAPRVRDWAQLSPALKLRPGSGVRSLLVCVAFDPETISAAASLEEGTVELLRWAREEADFAHTQLEWLTLAEPAIGGPGQARESTSDGLPRSGPVEAPPFRSGLSEEDLELSPEERQEFE